jgi:hypothetical protein
MSAAVSASSRPSAGGERRVGGWRSRSRPQAAPGQVAVDPTYRRRRRPARRGGSESGSTEQPPPARWAAGGSAAGARWASGGSAARVRRRRPERIEAVSSIGATQTCRTTGCAGTRPIRHQYGQNEPLQRSSPAGETKSVTWGRAGPQPLIVAECLRIFTMPEDHGRVQKGAPAEPWERDLGHILTTRYHRRAHG